ncbi:VPLPA-CTERM sorting domain-containing protein [Tateyamaria sp.]|uniref:VPLPA-CTERM sorting domain-containing protein n=1 Tax=Tateyamaria sp. TaxID=1929288 RepID=UPI0039B8E566
MFSDQPFDAVRLSGRNFESDNHTMAANFARETGTSISPVPVPATLPLLMAAFGGFGFLSRRRRL